jgi:hypothetical protein
MRKLILVPLLLIIVLVSCDKDSLNTNEEVVQQNTLATIKNDMILPHEGQLNGVPPQFDWSQHPRIGWGNNPPSDWFAMIPWGQVYRDTNPITANNARIQIRNLQAWYLNSENTWVQWIFTSDIFGAHYLENYENDYNIPAEIRQEETGGISIKFLEGYNFHFWSSNGRVTINPNNIHGVWVSVQARLILDDSQLVDDRNEANFLLGVGGDYWKNLTVDWDNFQSSGDIAIGRMKYLSKEWKSFNMHTLSCAQINDFPPPFN